MLSVHGIEGIGVGAHINEKEIKIKIKIKIGTQEGGKRGMGKDIIVIKEESKKYKLSIHACVNYANGKITNMLIFSL